MVKPANQPTDNHEEVLLEQGKRIRALHAIISRPDLTFDQQIDETLRLGCQLLGTEIGKVGRLDIQNNTSEFLNTIVVSDLPARRGVILPLDKTFCHITFSSADGVAISHVAESEYSTHPAATFLGMQSYIGCSINVYGKKFGTINFSNRKPVAKAFTDADMDLVNLIGSWISVMMERQMEAEELKKSKEAAEEANLAKSRFLANMSHEIRTPLTAIIGFAETALEEGQDPENNRHALQTIRQSGEHLLNLINDVLDFSKIEAGKLEIENTRINPVELVHEVETIMSPHARKKGLDFSLDLQYPLPEAIVSDPLRLKQILLNLCGNAIKFTDSGYVTIRLQYLASSDTLVYSVLDSGIGMNADQITKLFKPFSQADASISRRFGGTGLGLSFSSKLAELLNGSLSVTSETGKGSMFSLQLMRANPEGGIQALNAARDNTGTNKAMQQSIEPVTGLSGNILLAEDNELNQLLIKRLLEKTGANITVAENGQVAVELAQKQPFDLVYMDMQMPVMSGIDAVRMLRANNYSKPIVMLTANVTLEDKIQCNEAGCNDYLTKPVNRKQLYEITEKYLTQKS